MMLDPHDPGPIPTTGMFEKRYDCLCGATFRTRLGRWMHQFRWGPTR